MERLPGRRWRRLTPGWRAGELAQWGLRLSQRTTRSDAEIAAARGKSLRKGILVGVWEESEMPAELWSSYWGRES